MFPIFVNRENGQSGLYFVNMNEQKLLDSTGKEVDGFLEVMANFDNFVLPVVPPNLVGDVVGHREKAFGGFQDVNG